MADQDDPVLAGLVKKLIAENASDDDIRAVIQIHKGKQAGDAPKSDTFRSPHDEIFTKALRSKGVEPTDTQREMSARMMEGAMSGGLSSSAPMQLGVKAAEFAPRLSGAVKGTAEKLYGGLLKAKDAVADRFPNVVQDLLAARVPISQAGRAKVIGNLKRLGTEKNALLDAADQRAMVPRETLRRGLDESLDTAITSSPTPVKDMTKLAKMERELIPDDPDLLPSHADRIKTQLQSQADRGYRATKTGAKMTDTAAKAKMNVAGEAKAALEAIEPKLKPINEAYASGKGQQFALRDALKRTSKHGPINVSDLIGGSFGTVLNPGAGTVAGVAAARLLSHPNTGSRIAIGLNELSRVPGLDQATKAALLALLSEQE